MQSGTADYILKATVKKRYPLFSGIQAVMLRAEWAGRQFSARPGFAPGEVILVDIHPGCLYVPLKKLRET